MPKVSAHRVPLSPEALLSLARLGDNLSVARLRRKESVKSWAQKLGVSVPTVLRMEAGDPGVSLAVIASALQVLGLENALGDMAAPEADKSQGLLSTSSALALRQGRERATQKALEARSNPPTTPPAPVKAKLRYRTNSSMQKVYAACIALAQHPTSELFKKDGTPRTGANVRIAFWAGFKDDQTRMIPPGTLMAAAYEAGREVARLKLVVLPQAPQSPSDQVPTPRRVH